MVGRNIKKYREEKKLTQDDLAEKLSIHFFESSPGCIIIPFFIVSSSRI